MTITEYIIPVVPADEKGKNLMFDFMNANRLIRCNACRYWSSEDGQTGYCNGFNLVYRKYDADYYCATAEPIEHDD